MNSDDTRVLRMRLCADSFISGFSLVEVVLAIGVAAFAVISIVGIFGGVLRSSEDNAERLELAQAVDSLRTSLDDTNFTMSFSNICTWATTQKRLVYVTYKVDSGGSPNVSGESVAGKWLDPEKEATAQYDAARAGRWIRGRLSVSPSNPGGSNLANYSRATIFVLAELDAIADPSQTNSLSATFQTTIAVLR